MAMKSGKIPLKVKTWGIKREGYRVSAAAGFFSWSPSSPSDSISNFLVSLVFSKVEIFAVLRPTRLREILYHVSARPPCTHQFSRATIRIS